MITQLAYKTLIIVGLFVIAIFVHKIGMIISAFVFKLRIKEICIFSGKSILNLKLKDFTLSVGFIPLGGYIKYYDEEFNQVSLTRKCLAMISGPFALMVLGVFLLGYEPFTNSFVSAFKQIFLGAYRPFSFGKEYFGLLFALIDNHSRDLLIGVFVTKFAAVNLLPIPGLNGGFIIAHWLISSSRPKLAFAIRQVSMLFFSSIWIGWIIAFGAYILKN